MSRKAHMEGPCRGSSRHLEHWLTLTLGAISLMLTVISITNHQVNGLSSTNATTSRAFANRSLFIDRHSQRRYLSTIPVNIQMKPFNELHGKIYIQTGANFTAKAEITDEKFKNATIEYQWSVKNKTILTNSNASEIVYRFEQADESNFLELLVFHHPNDTGVSNKSLVVRDPISIADPVGKLFLEHGELLNISLKYKGTGPFRYCRSFCLENSIKKRERECKECSPNRLTESQEIRIIQYLHPVGNWTLSFVVDNVASKIIKSYSIKITETIRPKSLPIIPIVSSILAVLILLIGVVLHIKFKHPIDTETADFDFIRQDYNDEDESFWEEGQSFAQRVRYLLFRADRSSQDNSMTDSNLSGVRFY